MYNVYAATAAGGAYMCWGVTVHYGTTILTKWSLLTGDR